MSDINEAFEKWLEVLEISRPLTYDEMQIANMAFSAAYSLQQKNAEQKLAEQSEFLAKAVDELKFINKQILKEIGE